MYKCFFRISILSAKHTVHQDPQIWTITLTNKEERSLASFRNGICVGLSTNHRVMSVYEMLLHKMEKLYLKFSALGYLQFWSNSRLRLLPLSSYIGRKKNPGFNKNSCLHGWLYSSKIIRQVKFCYWKLISEE